MEDKTQFIQDYTAKFVDAAKNLGVPKEGHVWLFRAEHMDPHPYGTGPEAQHAEQNAIGRWFGPTIGGRFEHFDRYVKAGEDQSAENITISAIQVPEAVAMACYMPNIDLSRRKPDAPWTELQKARHYYGAAPADVAFFFPPKTTANSADQLTLAKKVSRFGAVLGENKQTLIEIPMEDYKRISAEEWQSVGNSVDDKLGFKAVMPQLKLHQISSAGASR